MRIGELGERCGVSTDTIRYYERLGLLPAGKRLSNGYRDYEPETVRTVELLRQGKSLGFTLKEMRTFISLIQSPETEFRDVQEELKSKLNRIDQSISDLRKMRQEVASILETCPQRAAIREGCDSD